MIKITKQDEETFLVQLIEDTTTKHLVHISDKVYGELTNKKISKEKLLKKYFEFLLEREPKESIMSEFELLIIEKYFPEFRETIK